MACDRVGNKEKPRDTFYGSSLLPTTTQDGTGISEIVA